MLRSLERNFAEIDGLSAGFAHLDATEPPPRLSEVNHHDNLASTLDALCNASPINNPEVQAHEKTWYSIRIVRDGMQILWEHFVNVSGDLNLPVVHDIRKSYQDGKGLRREGIFAFRNRLTGQAPHGLGQIFAFSCLTYVTSCLLHCINRLDKGDILAGINLSFYFFQREDERQAFMLLAEKLWPEAKGYRHFTVLALNGNSRKLPTALRHSERSFSLPSTKTGPVSSDTTIPKSQAYGQQVHTYPSEQTSRSSLSTAPGSNSTSPPFIDAKAIAISSTGAHSLIVEENQVQNLDSVRQLLQSRLQLS